MNLHHLLATRPSPIQIGLIGAGKFSAMFLAQARRTPNLAIAAIAAIADHNPPRALQTLDLIGWPEAAPLLTDDPSTLLRNPALDVVIEATGDPSAGVRHCLEAIAHGHHIIMVNVEADALAGPLLARRAHQSGLIYSLAWGDQPALICEHVDWARACGFEVVCAGKGTRYLPRYHQSTPATVWDNYIFDAETAARGGMNPKMFNSFIDGSKSAIEMTAVSNATGLLPQPTGLTFPPVSRYHLAEALKSRQGNTEVISSLHRDGTPVEDDLMMGTFVVIRAASDYVRHCFEEYRMLPDPTFEYAALYRPTHLIGLELGISVASVVLRNEPTGAPRAWHSDAVATAKRNLNKGETLDGEGGYCVWGKQMAATESRRQGALPLGLASNVTLLRDIPEGETLRWSDVAYDETNPTVRLRRKMEAEFAR